MDDSRADTSPWAPRTEPIRTAGPVGPATAARPAVGEPFRDFHAHLGETLCGAPVSDVLVESGRRCQYFEHLAVEEGPDGRVRLKPLGRDWIAARAEREAQRDRTPPRPRMVDLTSRLARHPTKSYPARPLSDIRYLVIHHTGADPEVGAEAIAEEHVHVNDWPGIGYHFVIGADGIVARTQDLTTVSHHARQFNPVAVGIAVTGELSAGLPTTEQMASLGELLAMLLSDLGLGVWSIRGHREMVGTPCPGDTFLAVWKPRLLRQVAAWLDPGAITAAPDPPAPRPPYADASDLPPATVSPPAREPNAPSPAADEPAVQDPPLPDQTETVPHEAEPPAPDPADREPPGEADSLAPGEADRQPPDARPGPEPADG